MTKWTRLLAYHLAQTTEPEEAVRRAVSMIFGKPVTLDERGTKLWVPTQYDAEAIKSVTAGLLHRVSGPGTASVSGKEAADDRQQPTPSEEVLKNIKDMDRLTFREALEHYAKGKGQPIRIPLSSLDLSNVSVSQFDAGRATVELRGDDRLTIGTIELILVGPDTVIAKGGHDDKGGYDDYDFDIKFEGETRWRDVATALGYLVNEGYAIGSNARIETGPFASYQRLVHKVGRIRFYAIVGFLAFYGLYYVVPLGRLLYLFEPRPKAVVHHSIPSPDGKWSAVIYEVAPAPPNRNVGIIPAEQSFSFTEHRSFLNLRGQHDLTVMWLSNRVIEVTLPEGEKTYLKYSRVGDITVEYK